MIDRLQVAVRLRGAHEALDLGLRLLRKHAGPVYAATLLLVAPLALLLGWLLRAHPWAVPLLIWWLKPLWDRPILHILARATFGETPDFKHTLKALPGMFRRGLIASLLWRRLSDVRSLALPLWQLEAQEGAAYRRRRAVLLRRGRFQASLLAFACINFEVVLQLGLLVALELFVPQGSGFSIFEKVFEADPVLRSRWVDLLLQILMITAMVAVEPFYVAGGFGLYLNRRVELEGWDIELAFRRLGARLASLAAGAMLLFALALPMKAQDAGDSKAKSRAALEEVQRQPEFQTKRTRQGWHWKTPRAEAPKVRPAWLKALLKALAAFGRAIVSLGLVIKWALILAAAALAGGFLWKYRRAFIGEGRARSPEDRPAVLFGLDLRPESLPAHVSSAALALWRKGETRAALALLYRASLADLVNGFHLELPRGATEGECLRAAKTVLPEEGAAYFRHLTRAWQGVAYANHETADGEALCAGWSAHFRRSR